MEQKQSKQGGGNDVLLRYSDTDSILIRNFDLYGVNGTATPIDAYQFVDGSSIAVNVGDNYDGAGSCGIDKYDAEGTLVESQWAYLNGSHGGSYYNADGSSGETRGLRWQNCVANDSAWRVAA